MNSKLNKAKVIVPILTCGAIVLVTIFLQSTGVVGDKSSTTQSINRKVEGEKKKSVVIKETVLEDVLREEYRIEKPIKLRTILELEEFGRKTEKENIKKEQEKFTQTVKEEQMKRKLEAVRKQKLAEQKKRQEELKKRQEELKKKEKQNIVSRGKSISGGYIKEFRTSAYTNSVDENGSYGGKVVVRANGYDITNTIRYQGYGIVASDPNVLPFYSIIEIEGLSGQYVVLDTGSDIKGNRLDILMNRKSEAFDWGRQTVPVKIIRYGK